MCVSSVAFSGLVMVLFYHESLGSVKLHNCMSFSFNEWIGPLEALQSWVMTHKQSILRTLRPSEGYVSISFPTSIHEVTERGWKGPTATRALGSELGHWSGAERGKFEKAMDAGQKSLPSVVGKEMGLLFEAYVFLYLVKTYSLRVVGGRSLEFVETQRVKIEADILRKLRNSSLAKTVIDFIGIHAGGGSVGMGEMIYRKTLRLVKDCPVDSIEFLGGDGGEYASRLGSDTADLRIGCGKAMGANVRGNIGYSLKAVTETQVEVRSFSVGRAAKLLGAGKNTLRGIKDILQNPLNDEREKKELILDFMHKAADETYTNQPRKLAKLLTLLVTGGADTLPAYRMLVRNAGEPGWSGAIGRDFVAGDEARLGAKAGSEVTVKKTATYISLTYMAPGGNHYGTSVKFEPQLNGTVSVYVSNLVSAGGRGY